MFTPAGKRALQKLLKAGAAAPSQQAQLTTRQQAKILSREIQKYLRTSGRAGAGALENLPTPGGIWTPIIILLMLLFILVPIQGADGKLHTRLGWLLLALMGQAHIVGEQLVKLSSATTTYIPPAAAKVQQAIQQCQNQGCTCPPNSILTVDSNFSCVCQQGVAAPTPANCGQTVVPGGGSSGAQFQPVQSFGNATLTVEDYL